MEVLTGFAIRGAAKIELIDVETGAVNVWEGHNAVVNDGLNLFLERLINTTGALPLAHLALGSGTGSFPGGATGLYAEYHRQAITTASVASNVLTVKTYYTTAQASGYVRELGLTNAAGSGAGVLIDHIEVSPQQQKGSSQEMVISQTLTLTRA